MGIDSGMVKGNGISFMKSEYSINDIKRTIASIDSNYRYDSCYDLNNIDDVDECLQICLGENGMEHDISLKSIGDTYSDDDTKHGVFIIANTKQAEVFINTHFSKKVSFEHHFYIT